MEEKNLDGFAKKENKNIEQDEQKNESFDFGFSKGPKISIPKSTKLRKDLKMNPQSIRTAENNMIDKAPRAHEKIDISKMPSMRIYESTAAALEKLSEQINGAGPKRVQWKDIVEVAIAKVNLSDLKKLREEKLTATDRFEEMFRGFKQKSPNSSREQFLSELMKSVDAKNFQ